MSTSNGHVESKSVSLVILLCTDSGSRSGTRVQVWVQGLGFGVQVDLASASGSLHQLGFPVQYSGMVELVTRCDARKGSQDEGGAQCG